VSREGSRGFREALESAQGVNRWRVSKAGAL
jgi:hypothetical protein